MLKQRLDKLRQIERLQKQLLDLARWRESALARRQSELKQSHQDMMAALSEGLMQFGGAAAAGSRRIRALEVEIAGAQTAADAQARVAQVHGTRSRLAERVVDAAAAEHRGEIEKQSLAEYIALARQAAISGPGKP